MRSRYGEPARGSEHLESGLETGSVHWADPDCEVVVSVLMAAGDWWEGNSNALEVEIRSFEYARAASPARFAWLDELPPSPPVAETAESPTPASSEPEATLASARAGTEGEEEETSTVPAIGSPAPGPLASNPEPEAEEDRPDRVTAEELPERPEPRLTIVTPPPEPGDRASPERIAASYVPPGFPRPALRSRMEATVSLELDVLVDGSVGAVRVVRCDRPGYGFELAAAEAARQWRYVPATRGGEPVDMTIPVDIRFRLQER
jgi:protein TonB